MSIVNDISGFRLPFTGRRDGFFNVARGYDVLWSDIVIALFCPIGGRCMRRAFGSAVYTNLFDMLDEQTAQVIAYNVKTAIATYMPLVRVLNINTTIPDGKTFNISVTYTPADASTPQTRNASIALAT